MLPKRRAIGKTRPTLGWIILGLMVLFATRQVITDLLYGYSLGIYYGPEGIRLQANHHAQFHNLVLFSMLVVTMAMMWILNYATASQLDPEAANRGTSRMLGTG